MRDAVLHAMLPDPAKPHRSELSPYQYGQAFWAYVGGRWGDRAAIRLFDAATAGGVDDAVREVLQTEPEELFANLHSSLRETNEPLLEARASTADVALPLFAEERRPARFNIAPALSPDGTRLAFLSSRELFTMDLYLADATTGELLEKLVSADADPHFDYLSYIDSSVAWSRDGSQLAFTVFAQGEREIVLYDVGERRVTRRLAIAGVKGIRNPAWSPDGRLLAFSATAGTASDLYAVDVATGALTRLTADPYTAVQPSFSPDGRYLVFVTDRGPGTDLTGLHFGDLQLAILDLETKRIEPVMLFPRGKHINPQFAADGSVLYFIAEPDGVPDIFRYDLEARTTARLTALQTGVTGITAVSPALSVSAATNAIAFSVLENGRLNIYRLLDGEPLPEPACCDDAGVLPPAEPSQLDVVQSYLGAARPSETRVDAVAAPYEPRLDLAYIGPATLGVSVDSYGTGVGGSLSAYWTDPLATRQLATTVYGGSWGDYLDFQDAFGGETVYLNQKRRLQWGAVASRLPYLSRGTFLYSGPVDIDGEVVLADVFDTVIDVVTATEVGAFTQFPFSLHRRVEVAGGLSHIGYERTVESVVIPIDRPAFVETLDLPAPTPLDLRRASAAYVTDTSYYGFVSPLRGQRFRLEYEWTTGDLEFETALFDYRRYVFRKPVTFAFRALHLGRHGDDAESGRLRLLDVGRDTLVRGYDLDSFDVSECTIVPGSTRCPEFERLIGSRIAVLNFEVRYPLIGNRDFGRFRAPAFPLEAVFFIDVGAAWTAGQSVEWKLDRDTTERVPVVSAGLAARMLVGGFLPIQIYYARPYHRPREGSTWGFMISTGW
jgi:dipeptidyl aminopeptidase/acylaminoacyl peptidase